MNAVRFMTQRLGLVTWIRTRVVYIVVCGIFYMHSPVVYWRHGNLWEVTSVFFCFFRQARMGQVCPAFDFPSSRLCSGSNNTTDHSPSICRLFVLHSFHRVRNRRQRIDSRKRRNPQRVGYNRSNARPCPTSLLSILPAGISYFYPLQTAQTGEESSQSPRTRRMRPQRDSAV